MTIETTLSCEQLQDRLAALHQASLELVQDISFDSLLNRIVQIALDQVGASYAAIGVQREDGTTEHLITASRDEEQSQDQPQSPFDLGMMAVIAKAEGPIRVDYMHKSTPSRSNAAFQPGITSLLGVPIQLGARRLGYIYLTDKVNGEVFSPDDERVIETLAAYAAVAISNARFYHELRSRDRALTRRNQDLALLNNLASTLTSITDLDALLQTALNRIHNYFDVSAGEIFMVDEDQHRLQRVLHQGDAIPALWKQERFTRNQALVGQAARTGQPIVVELPHKDDPFLLSSDLGAAGIHQIACFPLSSHSEVLGVLVIATAESAPLDTMDTQLLSSIASWVGTAIENVHLNIQGRRLAVLEERERIGMDLHDGIIQSIYAVGLTLEHARLLLAEEPEQSRKRINQSIDDLNSTIRDLRAFIMDMRPRQLYEEDLMVGLKRLVNEFRANSLVETKLNGPSKGLDDLPDAHAIALFHICQEALANVAKHAQASAVEVLVWTTNDRVLMEIRDDGRGFNLNEVKLTLGHGISNMQTRARNVGGDVEITSEPGQGTTILAWMPYRQPNEISTVS
jgi:signal transduction histidine kinase